MEGVKQVVTLTEKSIVGVALADGKLLWQIPFVPQGRAYNATTPIVDGQTVYVTGSGRGTKALKIEKAGEAFTATELWTNADLACQFCTPVLEGGLLFSVSDKGNLFCLNAATGQAAWTDATAHGRGFGAMVVAGGLIFALPPDSQLLVFKPVADAYQEVAKYNVAEKENAETYAHPALSGKSIFIKGPDAVTLWTVG